MSAFLALVFGVVVAAILTLVVLVVIAKSFIVIGPAQVGLGTRRVSSRHNSTDDPVAFAGEAGYQSELLMPGVRFKLWPAFSGRRDRCRDLADRCSAGDRGEVCCLPA